MAIHTSLNWNNVQNTEYGVRTVQQVVLGTNIFNAALVQIGFKATNSDPYI